MVLALRATLFFLIISAACLAVLYSGALPWLQTNPAFIQRLLPNISDTGDFLVLSDRYHITRAKLDPGVTGIDDSERERLIENSIEIRPAFAPYWIERAQYYFKNGENEKASENLEAATTIWPNRPWISWYAAMLWLRIGDNDRALRALGRFIEVLPREFSQAIVIAARVEPDAKLLLKKLILDNALPAERSAEFIERAFDYSIKQKNQSLATEAWDYLYSNKLIESELTNRFLRLLIEKQDIRSAMDTWKKVSGQSVFESVVNSGFEEEMEDAVFGWNAPEIAGTQVRRDDQIFHQGASSIRIDFDGTQNVNFRNFWQIIPVQSGRSYRLTGHWRGESVSTRSNPYLEIFSGEGDSRQRVRSESKRNTWNWQPIELELKVPDDASSLTVRLSRNKTDALDNKIYGTVWLDSIELQPL